MIRSHCERRRLLGLTVGLSTLVAMLIPASRVHGAPEGLLEKSTRALYRGDFVQASSLAEKYLKVHPPAPAALILLARAEMAQGKNESAYQKLLQARRVDPRNLDALYYLGQLCRILSQAEYQGLYEMAPDSVRVHQLLAESYRVQENLSKAAEEYQAALRAKPQSVEVLDALGDLKRSQFKFDEAISYYSRALEVQPRDYEGAYGLGASYLYLREPEKAIEYLQRALAIDPRSAPARLALGDARLRVSQFAEAVEELKTAVTLEPKMRQAYTLLAQAYRRLGKTAESGEALRRSNELSEMERKAREDESASEKLPSRPSEPTTDSNPPAGSEN